MLARKERWHRQFIPPFLLAQVAHSPNKIIVGFKAKPRLHHIANTEPFALTSSDTGEDKKPRDIRLFARNDNQGEWVEIYMQDGIKMPTGKNTEMTFNITSPGYYNSYRFEVGANWGNSFLDLNELTMNWAE